MRVICSLYTECSENFFRGGYHIFRTLKANHHDLGIVIEVDDESDFNAETDGIRQEDKKSLRGGVIHESRHNMTRLEPRTDGLTNTITTVLKDNLLIEEYYDTKD